jgi:hypothetical protein
VQKTFEGDTSGFTLDRYQPSELPDDGFAIARPIDMGSGRWSIQMQVDYGLDSLVYRPNRDDSAAATTVVQHHLVGNLTFAFGLFDRLVLHAGIPLHLVQDGEAGGGVEADGFGPGDGRVGARFVCSAKPMSPSRWP